MLVWYLHVVILNRSSIFSASFKEHIYHGRIRTQQISDVAVGLLHGIVEALVEQLIAPMPTENGVLQYQGGLKLQQFAPSRRRSTLMPDRLTGVLSSRLKSQPAHPGKEQTFLV